jgi:hypothetical protein
MRGLDQDEYWMALLWSWQPARARELQVLSYIIHLLGARLQIRTTFSKVYGDYTSADACTAIAGFKASNEVDRQSEVGLKAGPE